MLTISDPRPDRNCQGLARREFLKIGGLGFGGLGLADLLKVRAAAASGGPVVRDKSVVFLFLQGGPSHIETFDPKMSAPSEIRSIFGEVPTKHAGITFGRTFPSSPGWRTGFPSCGLTVPTTRGILIKASPAAGTN